MGGTSLSRSAQPSLPHQCYGEELWHRQTLPSLSWHMVQQEQEKPPFSVICWTVLFFTFTLNVQKTPCRVRQFQPRGWENVTGAAPSLQTPKSKWESSFIHSPPSLLLTLCIHCEDIFGYCWMKQHCGIPTLEDKFPSLTYWHLTKLLRSSRNLMYSWCSRAVLSSINSSAKVLSTPLSARKSIKWS